MRLLQKEGRSIDRKVGEVVIRIGSSKKGVYRAIREVYNLLGSQVEV